MKLFSLKNSWTVKLLISLLLVVTTYAAAHAYWYWQWQTPRLSLPDSHLSNTDIYPVEPSWQQTSEQAQSALVGLANELQSVSMSGAIMHNGNLAWAGTVGLAKVAPIKAANTDTQYRIGSVSKSITAVALMKMVEQGLIDLNATIDQYLPDYPKHASKITVKHLLSHMSGIRHYRYDLTKFPATDSLSNHHYQDSTAALEQFKNDDLSFQPGQGFAYSTHGYTLLSAVMQAAAGKQFESIIDEVVSTPLKINSLQAEHLLTNKVNLAGFYNSDNGLYGNTPEQNLSNKVAGGGLVATPSDLVKIGSALLDNTLLSESSFEQMTQVQPMFDGSDNPQYYALGWRHYETRHILGEENMVDIIHHGGVSVGANSFLMLVPKYNISVAVLTNGKGEKSRGEIQRLAYKLAKIVIENSPEISQQL